MELMAKEKEIFGVLTDIQPKKISNEFLNNAQRRKFIQLRVAGGARPISGQVLNWNPLSASYEPDNISSLVFSIVGITGTKAEYNVSLTDGNFLFVGDVTQYTNEMAQDAVGNILTDSVSIDFTYNDGANTITAVVLPAGVDHDLLGNLTTGDAHTQYALLAGRAGGQSLSGGTAANDDLTLQGTTNGTRTTSYVILQPSGGNVGVGTVTPTKKLGIDGDLSFETAGNGIYFKEGANGRQGVATLVTGTVTVNTTAVGANSRIFLTVQGGTLTNLGMPYVSAKVNGTSFTISSTNILDACDVAWLITEAL